MKILGACLGLVVADEHGQTSNQTPSSLDVITRPGIRHVNMDACTVSGIHTAHALGFASLQPADAVYSPYVPHAMEYLFDDAHRAAAFALFRHPIDRVVSLYYYVQLATWDILYQPEIQNMTLQDFVMHHHAEDNFILRTLLDKTDDKANTPVTREDLIIGKRLLRDFVLVGLTDQMDESMRRFAQAFGWDDDDDDINNSSSRWESCRSQASQGHNRFNHPQLHPGDDEWDILAARNEFDLELFRYAEELFLAQADYF